MNCIAFGLSFGIYTYFISQQVACLGCAYWCWRRDGPKFNLKLMFMRANSFERVMFINSRCSRFPLRVLKNIQKQINAKVNRNWSSSAEAHMLTAFCTIWQWLVIKLLMNWTKVFNKFSIKNSEERRQKTLKCSADLMHAKPFPSKMFNGVLPFPIGSRKISIT